MSANQTSSPHPLSAYLATRQPLPEAAQSVWTTLFQTLLTQLAQGHTVLRLDPEQQQSLSQLDRRYLVDAQTAAHQAAPLVQAQDYLWLHRLYSAEKSLVSAIKQRLDAPPLPLDTPSLTPYLKDLTPAQQQALQQALSHQLTIINGGPGTGKTYTLARIVQAALARQPNSIIRLAAPTGKAAKRMEESLRQTLDNADQLPLESAQTLHRLLGISPTHGARYHQAAPLDLDLLIVDEASMLSLALAQQLFAALPSRAQLILLGDANQLAAVEPGAVLHDICRSPQVSPAVVTLEQSQRFRQDSSVAQLANTVLTGDSEQFFNQLKQQSITWHQTPPRNPSDSQALYDHLFAPYQPYLQQLSATPSTDLSNHFASFDQYRILCAGHNGALGATAINHMLRQRHLKQLKLPLNSAFYHGLPIMILSNTPQLQLFNGDIGICLLDRHSQTLNVHFPGRRQGIAVNRLNRHHISDAYAQTIHKSQGSEFAHSAIVIDHAQTRLISRELLYTAITRSKNTLSLYADPALLATAITTPTQRQTGLQYHFET